jgi:hypothetical protein
VPGKGLKVNLFSPEAPIATHPHLTKSKISNAQLIADGRCARNSL